MNRVLKNFGTISSAPLAFDELIEETIFRISYTDVGFSHEINEKKLVYPENFFCNIDKIMVKGI